MADTNDPFTLWVDTKHAETLQQARQSGYIPTSPVTATRITFLENSPLVYQKALVNVIFAAQLRLATLVGLWLWHEDQETLSSFVESIKSDAGQILSHLVEDMLVCMKHDTIETEVDYPVKALLTQLDECRDVERESTAIILMQHHPDKLNDRIIDRLTEIQPTMFQNVRRIQQLRKGLALHYIEAVERLIEQEDEKEEKEKEEKEPCNPKFQHLITQPLIRAEKQLSDVLVIEQVLNLQQEVFRRCASHVTVLADKDSIRWAQSILGTTNTVNAIPGYTSARFIRIIPIDLTNPEEANLQSGSCVTIACNDAAKTSQPPLAVKGQTTTVIIYLTNISANEMKKYPVAVPKQIIRVRPTSPLLPTLIHLPLAALLSKQVTRQLIKDVSKLSSDCDPKISDPAWERVSSCVLKTIQLHTSTAHVLKQSSCEHFTPFVFGHLQ